jgi:ABC-type antimicrobial peptide transport system permease subunit
LTEVAGYAALFLVVVFAVLLIACDDIAIMLFARIVARQREMGIRVALGGSRLQLIRQLVAENVLLSVLGGAGSLTFMLLASRVVERLTIPLPDTARAMFDWRVLAFRILTALATTHPVDVRSEQCERSYRSHCFNEQWLCQSTVSDDAG